MITTLSPTTMRTTCAAIAGATKRNAVANVCATSAGNIVKHTGITTSTACATIAGSSVSKTIII